jgi:hypothetical protein
VVLNIQKLLLPRYSIHKLKRGWPTSRRLRLIVVVVVVVGFLWLGNVLTIQPGL